MLIVGGLALMVALPLGYSHTTRPRASRRRDHRVSLYWTDRSLHCALCCLVTHFMVPVMYRRRCLAREAFSDVINLFLAATWTNNLVCPLWDCARDGGYSRQHSR
jgi:hypothetical protein